MTFTNGGLSYTTVPILYDPNNPVTGDTPAIIAANMQTALANLLNIGIGQVIVTPPTIPSGIVTFASNTQPITITTPSTNGLQNNDTVQIMNVGGNTNANGFFKVKNVTATTFDLYTGGGWMGGGPVKGNGVYSGGGTWQKQFGKKGNNNNTYTIEFQGNLGFTTLPLITTNYPPPGMASSRRSV